MEKGNVSKKQQPDHRSDNSRRPPMGFQCSEKLPHPSAVPITNMYTSSVIMDVILTPNYTQETKIKNNTIITKAKGS